MLFNELGKQAAGTAIDHRDAIIRPIDAVISGL